MDYLGILRRSFNIAIKYKTLWIFGILLALFAGRSSGCNFDVSIPTNRSSRQQPTSNVIPNIDPHTLVIVIGVIIFFVLLFIAIGLFCRFWASGALIGSVNELEETQTQPTFRRGASLGFRYFWRLLGIAFFIWVPFIIILLSGYLPALFFFLIQQPVLAIIFLILAVVFTIGLGFIWGLIGGVINVLADRECVVEQAGVIDSIKFGFRLLIRNLGHIIVMWLSLWVSGCLFGCALSLVVVPAIILLIVAFIINLWFGMAFLAPIIILFIGVLVASGIFQVFSSAAWTLTYRELPSRAVQPIGTEPPKEAL